MTAEPKKIDIEDIRVGDKIRIIDVTEGSVTQPTRAAGSVNYIRLDGVTRTKNGATAGMERTFYLVERPIELPTKPGSVIRYSVDGATVTWLLMSSGYWQGFRGLHLSAEALKDVLERSPREFEVL